MHNLVLELVLPLFVFFVLKDLSFLPIVRFLWLVGKMSVLFGSWGSLWAAFAIGILFCLGIVRRLLVLVLGVFVGVCLFLLW